MKFLRQLSYFIGYWFTWQLLTICAYLKLDIEVAAEVAKALALSVALVSLVAVPIYYCKTAGCF